MFISVPFDEWKLSVHQLFIWKSLLYYFFSFLFTESIIYVWFLPFSTPLVSNVSIFECLTSERTIWKMKIMNRFFFSKISLALIIKNKAPSIHVFKLNSCIVMLAKRIYPLICRHNHYSAEVIILSNLFMLITNSSMELK